MGNLVQFGALFWPIIPQALTDWYDEGYSFYNFYDKQSKKKFKKKREKWSRAVLPFHQQEAISSDI